MATTINAYSVSLSLDAKDYITASGLARNETKALYRDINQARTPTENFARAQDRLARALASGSIEESTYTRLLESKRQEMEKANGALEAYNQKLHSNASLLSEVTGRMKGMIASYVGFQTITKSIKLAIDAENAVVQFEVLSGSANDAIVLLQQLREFSDKSPLTFGATQDAAKMMLSYGIAIQDVSGYVRILGDVTGGNVERFKSMAFAFSQATAAGRLQGQNLRQMVDAGFNPLKQIMLTTGEDMIQLKKRMEEGGISADEMAQAFMNATSEGGRFNGLTDRLSQNMGGKLAIAMSDLEKAGISLGQTLAPVIIQFTDGFHKANSTLNDAVGLIRMAGDGLGYMLAVQKDLRDTALNLGMQDGGLFANQEKYTAMLEQRDREEAERAKKRKMSEKEEGDQKIDNLEEQKRKQQEVDKVVLDHNNFLADLAKKRQESEDKITMSALENAKRFFEEDKKKQDKLRADVSKGPGAGISVGSAEAARFQAEQVNKALGVAAVPVKPTPGEKEIIEEAKRQRDLIIQQTESQAKQLEVMRQMLEEAKKNGFKRI